MNSAVMGTHLECIKFILNNWAEFQGALAQGCGGANSNEKAAWLPSGISEWLWHPKNIGANAYELEEVLDDILNAEFNLNVADGTVVQICNKILDAQNLCMNGRSDEAKNKYCINVSPKLPSFVKEHGESSSEDEEEVEVMDVTESDEPPRLVSGNSSNSRRDAAPKVDKDGWEVVSGRKNKHR